MAILNIDLLGGGETVINSGNASDGDTINLNVLGSGTLVVDGVDVSINSLVGVGAAASPTFAAENGGSLTVNQGLLTANLLSNPTFEIRDDGFVRLDASSISLGLTETLLNRFNVEYSGAANTGTFAYDPPAVSLLALGPQTFNVTGMGATDVFTIDGRTNLRIDAPLSGFPPSRDPEDAYRDGVFHLTSPGTPLLGETVNIEIPMTREEFDQFLANPSQYLSGGTFVFPGQLAVPCFTRGTLIRTDRGDVAVELLSVGDLVMTKDHGLQPIRWIGSRVLNGATLRMRDNLRPVRISAGALGNNTPSTDLVVSPQHRILVRSKIAQKMFDTDEVLVAAKQLLQLEGINIAEDLERVEYFHLLFDQHEVVVSNGAATESLYTGPEALKSVGDAARAEIFTLFPELQDRDHEAVPARVLASGRMGRRLVVRHLQHKRSLVQ